MRGATIEKEVKSQRSGKRFFSRRKLKINSTWKAGKRRDSWAGAVGAAGVAAGAAIKVGTAHSEHQKEATEQDRRWSSNQSNNRIKHNASSDSALPTEKPNTKKDTTVTSSSFKKKGDRRNSAVDVDGAG